jgi:hypothetical protein
MRTMSPLTVAGKVWLEKHAYEGDSYRRRQRQFRRAALPTSHQRKPNILHAVDHRREAEVVQQPPDEGDTSSLAIQASLLNDWSPLAASDGLIERRGERESRCKRLINQTLTH